MASFQVAAIPTAVAQSVRNTQKAPGYGFPAHKEVAAGRAPCRHCLRLIKVNEEELYLSTTIHFASWVCRHYLGRCTCMRGIANGTTAEERFLKSITGGC